MIGPPYWPWGVVGVLGVVWLVVGCGAVWLLLLHRRDRVDNRPALAPYLRAAPASVGSVNQDGFQFVAADLSEVEPGVVVHAGAVLVMNTAPLKVPCGTCGAPVAYLCDLAFARSAVHPDLMVYHEGRTDAAAKAGFASDASDVRRSFLQRAAKKQGIAAAVQMLRDQYGLTEEEARAQTANMEGVMDRLMGGDEHRKE